MCEFRWQLVRKRCGLPCFPPAPVRLERHREALFKHQFEKLGWGLGAMTRPSDITRERILKAAQRLFADRGYKDTSVRDLIAIHQFRWSWTTLASSGLQLSSAGGRSPD
jgi:hypothetical protein